VVPGKDPENETSNRPKWNKDQRKRESRLKKALMDEPAKME
jgi:hypothetical protein